jgi:hypothetical protein
MFTLAQCERDESATAGRLVAPPTLSIMTGEETNIACGADGVSIIRRVEGARA